MTGEDLYNLEVETIPYIIEPLFPKTGVVALVGSSDTGKSTLLRQLAISIVTGKETFLNIFKINAEHKNVIYISTEDDIMASANVIRKQAKAHIKDASELKGLRFIFNDTENYLAELNKLLSEATADCVIVDAFTDVFSGELNASTKVRSQINEYDKLANKYKTLIIFLHHTGKRTDQYSPSKDNILGSQGFEAKMRCVMELRVHGNDSDLRHLCIVKGNYIASVDKKSSYVLKLSPDLNFEYTYKRVPFEAIKSIKKSSNFETKREEATLLALRYKKDGHSFVEITKKLNNEGFKFSKTTINNWVSEFIKNN